MPHHTSPTFFFLPETTLSSQEKTVHNFAFTFGSYCLTHLKYLIFLCLLIHSFVATDILFFEACVSDTVLTVGSQRGLEQPC